MRTRIVESISRVPAADWDAVAGPANPFVQHAFLATLEDTGCVSSQSGWHPCHVLCESDAGALLGALPLYLKTNPYGEFVFDYAWAGAYQRAGLSYYPKLVSAVPFTPATGPRLLVPAGPEQATVQGALVKAATAFAADTGASSLHVLFPEPAELDSVRQAGLLLRKDCQFHWQNRAYRNFDHFLGGFTASKRKKTKRERRRVREAGVTYRVRSGHDLTAADWERIMVPYSSTFLMRGREPYLDAAFFIEISRRMPDNVVVFCAEQAGELAGISICFRSADTLYGRYWGANRFIDSLHFETCYYQGIDYCIAEGIERFEPGTQGEHKIARGFVPTETWSAHWLSHPQFAAAIDDYLDRERAHIDEYMDVLGEHVPYKTANP